MYLYSYKLKHTMPATVTYPPEIILPYVCPQFLDKPHLSKHYTQYLHFLVKFYPPCIWSSMSNSAEWNTGMKWSMGLHPKQCPNTTHDIWNHILYKLYFNITSHIPVAAQSKAWVCVAPCLLGLWDRIPTGHGSLFSEHCVLSGRDLCVRLITCPGVLPRVVCLSVIIKPR